MFETCQDVNNLDWQTKGEKSCGRDKEESSMTHTCSYLVFSMNNCHAVLNYLPYKKYVLFMYFLGLAVEHIISFCRLHVHFR